MRYTIYVFDSGVTTFDEVLGAGKLSGANPFEAVTLTNVTFQGQAYLQRNRIHEPPWLSEVLPYCQITDPHKIKNVLNSLIVAIKTKSGTMCAMTQGQGFMHLNKEHVR